MVVPFLFLLRGCLKREPWALETVFLFGAQGFLGNITKEKASYGILGPSGSVLDSVPVCSHCFLSKKGAIREFSGQLLRFPIIVSFYKAWQKSLRSVYLKLLRKA